MPDISRRMQTGQTLAASNVTEMDRRDLRVLRNASRGTWGATGAIENSADEFSLDFDFLGVAEEDHHHLV